MGGTEAGPERVVCRVRGEGGGREGREGREGGGRGRERGREREGEGRLFASLVNSSIDLYINE